MNKLIKSALAGCLVMVAGIWAAPAGAWTVTLDNPTRYPARVSVYWGFDGLADKRQVTVDMAPGSNYQWKTGAYCPAGFSGKLDTPHGWRGLKGAVFLKCWNIHYKICQRRGQGYTEVRHEDYGFCTN